MTEFVLNDSTDIDNHNLLSKGLCGCFNAVEQFGKPVSASNKLRLIPWAEMPDMIADQEKHQSSPYHMYRDSGMVSMDQGQLNYCWGFCVGGAIAVYRICNNYPFVKLSSSSLAGPVVGYRNVGGYIVNALKQAVNVGIATTDYVPERTLDSSQFKTGWRESAACNRVTEWLDIGADPQYQMSAILQGYPLPVQHSWWSHAILHLQVLDRYPKMRVDDPLRYGRRFLNSWSGYGDNGVAILEGQRSIADESKAIEQVRFVG